MGCFELTGNTNQMPQLNDTFAFHCSFLNHPLLATVHTTRAQQLCTLQYILQDSHVQLTSSPLAVLAATLNRAMGFRKFGLFLLSATNLLNKSGNALSLSLFLQQ